jgi:uncharacterized protein
MTTLDFLCLGLIALVMLLDHFVLWRAFLRRSEADSGPARLWLYPVWVSEAGTLVASVSALWMYERRPWGALRLIALHGWRLWASMGLMFVVAIMLSATIVKVARPKRRRRIKMQGHVEGLVPRTRLELGWWALVSLSAGFSEELIFRGYLIWAFTPLIGLWGAAALSVAVFAAAHGYQGGKGVLATGVVGGLLTLLVLILGSLWPAIAMHALIDLEQGVVAWLLLREVREGDVLTGTVPA